MQYTKQGRRASGLPVIEVISGAEALLCDVVYVGHGARSVRGIVKTNMISINVRILFKSNMRTLKMAHFCYEH